jgi:radical SAM protein with 4Fe4S-binding SPASM domain
MAASHGCKERRMPYIVRDFAHASFIFDSSAGSAIFLEGPLSTFASSLIERPQFELPPSFLTEFEIADQKRFVDDWAALREKVNAFIAGESETPSTGPDPGSSDAFRDLSEYAVRNWQLTNVSVELTNQCNQRCKACYLGGFKDRGLTRWELRRIGRELRAANVVFVLFTGGEVFTRSDATAIMSDFSEMGFGVEIKTNGALLTESKIREIVRLPLLDVQVSIYEISDGWSAWTGSNYSFSRIAKNIQLMVDNGIPVTASVLVGKHNIDQLQHIHRCLAQCGAKVFYSPYITPNRIGPGQEVLYRLSLSEMTVKLKPFLEEIGAFSSLGIYRNCANDTTVCYAGRDQIAIGPDGVAYPCLDLRLPLGNLTKEPVAAVLERRKQELSRFSLAQIPKCQSCSLRNHCDSCVGIALIEHLDYRTPSSHKCDVTHFYANHKR